MKRRFAWGLAALITCLGTLACSNGSNGSPSFNRFVENLIQDTADNTEPTAINGQDFAFSENENAFDDLFP